MADDRRILAGSYKGVEILFDSSTVDGGRKTVVHSFPSRDTDLVEDLGGKPRRYALDVIITERPAKDYLDYRNDLMALFDQGGLGDLVHPLYGRITDVAALNYSINERISEFGSAILSVNFAVSGNRGIPQDDGNLASRIEQAAEATQSAATQTIADDFKVSARFNANFSSAADTVSDLVDKAKTATSTVTEITDEANELAKTLGDISADVISLLNQPQALADAVGSVFDGVGAVYAGQQAALDGLTAFFGFGGGDLPAPTTAGLIERQKNQRVLDGAINTAALANAYAAAAQIEYATEQDIDNAAATLEAQYQLILNSEADNDLKDRLADMRVNVVAAFNAARLTASKIITVDVQEQSVRLLAFDYYGNDDNGILIADLNNVQDANSIEGEVKLVTA